MATDEWKLTLDGQVSYQIAVVGAKAGALVRTISGVGAVWLIAKGFNVPAILAE